MPQWGVCAFPESEEVKSSIEEFFQTVQKVRTILDARMFITSGYRPVAYNDEIGGSEQSYHLKGRAVDFVVEGYETEEGCHHIRNLLFPHLEELNLRMEFNTGKWIHLDNGEVINERVFFP